MAKNATKKPGGRKPSAKPSIDRASQAIYTRRRDTRIANLYFVHRVTKPPAIYDELLTICRECGERELRHQEMIGQPPAPIIGCAAFASLITPNRRSGIRMIQDVVKRIREEAEPEEVLALRRPIETEKVRRTYEHLLRIELEVADDRSLVKRQKISPSGAVMTVLEPRYSEADRARARKNAKDLNERIGRLDGAILVAVDEPEHPPTPGDEGARQQGFAFVFPNVNGRSSNLDDMVAMNMERGKVN